jgi:hypothetical protein
LGTIYRDNLWARGGPKQVLFWVLAVLLVLNQQLSAAQDTVKNAKAGVTQTFTSVSGTVFDAVSGRPVANVTIRFVGSSHGTSTDKVGEFTLKEEGYYKSVSFNFVGYLPQIKSIKAGRSNELNVRLKIDQTQLKEVSVSSGRHKKYHNKDNPAVELIRQVIAHKDENRPQSTAYLQYDQYERIGMSFYQLSPKFINSGFFSKYKFMLDTAMVINGEPQTALPVYFSEKLSQHYYRKSPEKAIEILTAQKQINIIKFMDTVGLDIYMNRLYGNNIDIYENNIFVVTDQFLSPIANHSPDFYKFFIVDTIQVGNEKLVELNFTPRNKGDLLFEGKILVTLDGRYAVQSCTLNVNKQINLNFLRSLKINLDFTPYDGRYYLSKSNVTADFGLFRNKGSAVFGERTVFYTNYKLNIPLDNKFYQGKSFQEPPNPSEGDTAYWAKHRTDTLSKQQTLVYTHINTLAGMKSFKRTTWLASTFVDGYAKLGAVQLGPTGALYSFDYVEGNRFQVGGRTTPIFNKTIYLEGYGAYATKSNKFEGEFSTSISLNKTPFYRYPNDYFRVSYLYDVNVPGYNYAITNQAAALSSFTTGKSNYFVYSKIFSVDYVKDFDNHISYDITLRSWDQQAAGTLLYLQNNAANTPVNNLTTTEAGLRVRYAPHEQIIQGTQYRHTIYSKYPILNVQITHDFKDVLNGSYSFTDFNANIAKRFYFSQLGYGDATLLGNYLLGKVPFPLLTIPPANQSLAYNPDAYNGMDYLEFVSDHYIGFNFTQSFNGFFLNKIPLLDGLKLREFLSFKILYGGLRTQNNPLYTNGLYSLPTAFSGQNGTFALGNTPYIEAGVGIGNIFKLLRLDLIRRLDYLDHPGVSTYVIKFSINPDL